MRKKLFRDISANTFQVMLNQVSGLFIFLITSRYLSKEVYGEMNWSLALLTFMTTLLSLRLEQIVVRRVASGDNASKMLTLFLGHTVFFGTLFYLVLLAGNFLFPSFFAKHTLLLILAISHLLSFFSSPFKQLANGKENFRMLTLLSVTSNFIRSIWLLWVVIYSTLSIEQLLVIYIISSLAELALSVYLVEYRLHIRLSSRWKIGEYFTLIRQSLPQIGTVFLNACIARIDWILLGFFATAVRTAEYSFAYKIFELSPIPLLIIGPVLLSRFSKYFSANPAASLGRQYPEIGFLIRIELVLATLLPLVLNIIWVPLIDFLTQQKYGAVNKTTFLLLSCCIPFQYMINLCWTLHFAQDHLNLIFRITAITCLVIITGDLIMIPLANARGAALVYLLAMGTEYLFYLHYTVLPGIKKSWVSMGVCMSGALLCGFSVQYIQAGVTTRLLVAVTVYILFLLLTKQVRKSDFRMLKQWASHQENNN